MPEYSFERHGAEGFVLLQDGEAHDPRIVLHDRQSALNLIDVFGPVDDADIVDLDDPDNLARLLWSELAGEEASDAPVDLHTHGEHVGDGLIVVHAHPFEEGVDHHHQIVIAREAAPGEEPIARVIALEPDLATEFARKLVNARDALRETVAHLAEPNAQLRNVDREAIAGAWEYLKASNPVGPAAAGAGPVDPATVTPGGFGSPKGVETGTIEHPSRLP